MMHRLPHLQNKNGQLFIEGVKATDLAERYGTPVYIYSKSRIIENYRRFKNAFKKAGVDIQIHYAIKTNNNLMIIEVLKNEGAGVDVSCEMEIKMAEKLNIDKAKIIYSGNNNPNEALKYSLKRVGKINLDDVSILPRLLKFGIPDILSFRLNPGIGSGSHKTNVFGGMHSKFGVTAEKALEGYKMALKSGVKKFGIHMMPGTGGLDEEAYPNATRIMIETMEMIHKETGIVFEFMNIGGGFGIPYKKEEKSLNIEKIAKKITNLYKAALNRGRIGKPTLDSEPGRYMIGDAGILLTKIHCLKESYKLYVGTDAGMNTMIRPALHGSYHEIICTNRLNEKNTKKGVFTGPICENGDQYPGDRPFPKMQEGDLLAVMNTGAYGYSMASNYNTQPKPAEVMVEKKHHRLIRRRETFKDLIRLTEHH